MGSFVKAAALMLALKIQTILAQTATFNGTAIDVVDYEGLLALTLSIGAVTGTTPTLDLKVQSSATSGGTFVDVPGAVWAQKAAAAADTVDKITIDLDACQRWIRIVATIAGTSPSFTMSVNAHGVKKF